MIKLSLTGHLNVIFLVCEKGLSYYRVNTNQSNLQVSKGGKCLKKLWCCVGGSITR